MARQTIAEQADLCLPPTQTRAEKDLEVVDLKSKHLLGPSEHRTQTLVPLATRLGDPTLTEWEGRKVPTKSLFEQEGPQNWNPEVFDQTRCSRTFACRNCSE